MVLLLDTSLGKDKNFYQFFVVVAVVVVVFILFSDCEGGAREPYHASTAS